MSYGGLVSIISALRPGPLAVYYWCCRLLDYLKKNQAHRMVGVDSKVY